MKHSKGGKIKYILNLFSALKGHKPRNRNAFLEGQEEYTNGEIKLKNRECEAALTYFDKAIEHGYGRDAFEARGFCLHDLGYSLDAIEDFDKAIAITTDDPNLFYMRSLCKWDTGDLEGAISDCEGAIKLSEIDNVRNSEYNIMIQKRGWHSVSDFYASYLNHYKLDLEHETKMRLLYQSNPKFINQFLKTYNKTRRLGNANGR